MWSLWQPQSTEASWKDTVSEPACCTGLICVLLGVLDFGSGKSRKLDCATLAVCAVAYLVSSTVQPSCRLQASLACGGVIAIFRWYLGRRECAPTLHVPETVMEVKGDSYPMWDPSVPFIEVSEMDMEWFEDVVMQINAVTFGRSNVGTVAGKPIAAWPRGNFRPALLRLRQAVGNTKSVMHEPLDDVMLARILIATSLDHDLAVELVAGYREYRRTVGGGVPPHLRNLEAGSALVVCEDLMDRPVLLIRARYLTTGDPENFRRGLRSILDVVSMHILHKRHGLSRTNPLEQYVMVVDLEGFTLANADWETFKVVLEEGQRRYPNRLANIYILHVSQTFNMLYNWMGAFMHPRTKRKLVLVPSKDVQTCMSSLISKQWLPPKYGGHARPLPTPLEARTLEDQCGELAARVLLRVNAVPAGARPPREHSSLSLMPEIDVEPTRASRYGCCSLW